MRARYWRIERTVPAAIRREFISNLSGTLPVFGGGGISTVAVSFMLAATDGHPYFRIWAGVEICLMAARLASVRAIRIGGKSSRGLGHTLIWLELLGAISVGFGAAACIVNDSAMATALGWMTAVALAAETSFRNLSMPRLIVATSLLGVAPCTIACLFSGDASLQAGALLTTLFVASNSIAAFRLNRVLVTTMRAERENDNRARHDKLTGLLNRAGLERELELLKQDSVGANLALFYLDLDGFKLVNDTFGHAAGDRVLRSVAEKLLMLAGPGDIVARIGGDEFIVVSSLGYINADEFGAAIIGAVGRANQEISTSSAQLSVSVGVSQSDDCGYDLATLMSAADAALYTAKKDGGSRSVIAMSAPRDSWISRD